MAEPFSYEVVREGDEVILRIDCEEWPYVPSMEDNAIAMQKVMDILVEVPNATKIVFSQKRDYEYDHHQTRMIAEIARLYLYLLKRKDIIGYSALGSDSEKHAQMQNILSRTMRSDPIGAYVELRRLDRDVRIKLDSLTDAKEIEAEQKYESLIAYVLGLMEKTRLITISKPYISGYKLGDRDIYRKIFRPMIKPDFMYTKLMSNFPPDGEELATYTVGDNTEITIFGFPDSVKYLYHMSPPEFKLREESYEILDLARKIMAEHKPKRSEFVDPKRMREVFYNVGRDLIEELVNYKGYKMRMKEMDELARVLVRYTVGFGLIEVLLSDDKIQDISVNSPLGQIPMFIVHQDFFDCYTNIIPTRTEAESWASKLRMISGRPLDEANQILDTEIEIPGAAARVSAITEPLDPTGLAFAFRRHRDKPWTLPLFVNAKMMNPLAAGLISFFVDGTRTMLIAGTRSSGKSSVLSSILIEIMRRYRLITVEDTLELPTNALRKLGYNIQPMKVASALAKGTSEMGADDGIRATLRLGDSALIVGEVRSTEAKALYEAMRVGAAANVVAGTIHGDSPYGVFDRVVNDIGVPKTSFKATDICIIANPVRSAGGIRRLRRITQITEIRKKWENDPLAEGGFVDLMKYDAKSDTLKPSDELINGDSEILKTIAGSIKEFAGNWDAMWENVLLRAKLKETLVNYANKANDLDMLEAPFVIKCNDKFHKLAEDVAAEVGSVESKRVFAEWDEWLKREIKKRGIKSE